MKLNLPNLGRKGTVILLAINPGRPWTNAPGSISTDRPNRECSDDSTTNLNAFDILGGRPCRDLFERLASRAPAKLVNAIRLGILDPVDVSFAAEALGTVEGVQYVHDQLIELLGDENAIVREGALYGLAQSDKHLTPSVWERLKRIATTDPSPGVRSTAQDVLDS